MTDEADKIVAAIKSLEKKVEDAGYFVADKQKAAIQEVVKALSEIAERLDRIEKKFA